MYVTFIYKEYYKLYKLFVIKNGYNYPIQYNY